MNIGFTGTKGGMTDEQQQALFHILVYSDIPDKFDFHHGNCVGADEEAAEFVKVLRSEGVKDTWVIAHPPTDKKLESKFESDEYRPRKPYIQRNHDIVDEVEFMFSCPSGKREFLRSGTWATTRYTRKMKKNLIIIFPDGSFKAEILNGSFEIRTE